MQEVRVFLKEEMKKPLRAFWSMLRWLGKQIALYVLRLVLWSLFFVLPSLALIAFGFHWLTGKVRNEIQNVNLSNNAVIASTPTVQTHSDASALRSLSQDLRFWIHEFERFRS